MSPAVRTIVPHSPGRAREHRHPSPPAGKDRGSVGGSISAGRPPPSLAVVPCLTAGSAGPREQAALMTALGPSLGIKLRSGRSYLQRHHLLPPPPPPPGPQPPSPRSGLGSAAAARAPPVRGPTPFCPPARPPLVTRAGAEPGRPAREGARGSARAHAGASSAPAAHAHPRARAPREPEAAGRGPPAVASPGAPAPAWVGVRGAGSSRSRSRPGREGESRRVRAGRTEREVRPQRPGA